MIYNSAQEHLRLPEYGRNVQNMVNHMKTIQDRDERNDFAVTIINIMAILNPASKEGSDYRNKLWDHLYMISGYDLDIDSPFEFPEKPENLPHPQKPSYASNHIKFRYYGKNTEKMLKAISEMEDTPERQVYTNMVSAYMKMSYKMWNEDKVPDEIIINHVKQFTNNVLEPTEIRELSGGPDQMGGMKFKSGISTMNKNNKKKKTNNKPKKRIN
ncbi:MAG: DUF4290 domain-containing protein [Bacteroidota bacterium]|nr:DUF4290 domain-containing protein [Bacteroidota bacterium]